MALGEGEREIGRANICFLSATAGLNHVKLIWNGPKACLLVPSNSFFLSHSLSVYSLLSFSLSFLYTHKHAHTHNLTIKLSEAELIGDLAVLHSQLASHDQRTRTVTAITPPLFKARVQRGASDRQPNELSAWGDPEVGAAVRNSQLYDIQLLAHLPEIPPKNFSAPADFDIRLQLTAETCAWAGQGEQLSKHVFKDRIKSYINTLTGWRVLWEIWHWKFTVLLLQGLKQIGRFTPQIHYHLSAPGWNANDCSLWRTWARMTAEHIEENRKSLSLGDMRVMSLMITYVSDF